jgi:hypothetical protein
LEDPVNVRYASTTGAAVVASILAIVNSTVAVAATKEEVAHCRAIEQRAERQDCFKFLKRSAKERTEDAAPAKTEDAAPAKTHDTAPPKAKNAPSAKAKDVAPTQTRDTVPAKIDSAAPANVGEAAGAKTEQVAPAVTERVTPAKTPNSKTGDGLSPQTSDNPVTTSAIDHPSVAGQPLCVDTDALAAMLVAGLLTSDSQKAATNGCQTVPEDAKLTLLERYPSVFPSMRIVRVRVTSPTRPDLTFGFTIEMGR